MKSFFLTNFLGAFNDNFFKMLVMLTITGAVSSQESQLYNGIIQLLLISPYLLLSQTAGILADKYSKSKIIQSMKFAELLLCLLAGAALVYSHSTTILLTLVAMMGIHSCIMSPAKYASIPELVEDKSQITSANGIIDLLIFVAIVLGTACAGPVVEFSGDNKVLVALSLLAFSGIGFISSLFIPKLQAKSPDKHFSWNIFGKTISEIRELRTMPNLAWAVAGISAFWGIGGMFMPSIYAFAESVLNLTPSKTSSLVAMLGLGIGIGSGCAGRFAHNKVELGLVPIGSLIMAIGTLYLALFANTYISSLSAIFLTGFGGGFIVVPLQSMLQAECPEEKRGELQGLNNFLNNLAMVATTGLYILLAKMHVAVTQIYIFIALLIVALSLLAIYKLPVALIRCINWVFTNTIYKVTTVGNTKLPENKGILIVANHVSYADPLLILGAINRTASFIMFRPIYNHPLIKPFAKLMGAIPIDPRDGRRTLAEALLAARKKLENGEVVVIFPEGGISRNGLLLPFKSGFETIIKELDIPILPVNLHGLCWPPTFPQ